MNMNSRHRLQEWRNSLAVVTDAENISEIASNMMGFLVNLEGTGLWNQASWKCVCILADALATEHHLQNPGMSCHRCGKCCVRQVPRVSLYELDKMAANILDMSGPAKHDAALRCADSVMSDYEDPLLGVGVPCPMLRFEEGKRHGCLVWRDRPLICRLFGVSTTLSWDCPMWQDQEGMFPVLDKAMVLPVLELFSYARKIYARDVLQIRNFRQMMLVGTGVLALMSVRPPASVDPLVNAALPHRSECSEELYCKELPPPPSDLENEAGPSGA